MSQNRRGMDPLTHVPSLRDDMNRLFDSFLTPTTFFAGGREAGTWAPVVDVAETTDSVTVTAELPGIKPEDVTIDLTGNVLTLRGEKREEREEKGRNWHRAERSFGTFTRAVQLPETIDPEKAKARYEGGVLRIDIAKSEASKPRSIKIDVR